LGEEGRRERGGGRGGWIVWVWFWDVLRVEGGAWRDDVAIAEEFPSVEMSMMGVLSLVDLVSCGVYFVSDN
jgi:hypothetical protein